MGDLRGKAVLVTGAGRGIGAAVCVELAGRGARVAAVDLDAAACAETASRDPEAITAYRADVTDESGHAAAVDHVAESLGGLDAAVACAGVAPVAPLGDEAEGLDRAVAVNLLGAARTLRLSLPRVAERGGYLLAVSSLAAPVQVPLMGAYAASKAGIEAYANTLRMEARPLGVAVGVATFGWIDTPMVAEARRDPGAAYLRSRARGFLARDVPAVGAARAVADGIETRARLVCHPRWARAVLIARSTVQRMVEVDLLRAGPEAVRRSREAAARRGE